METEPNIILRGGPADGETRHLPTLGEPMPYEDEGGGSITYFDTGEVIETAAGALHVYEPHRRPG